jgi:glycosyltransferase involved in cell wall biosynthesis
VSGIFQGRVAILRSNPVAPDPRVEKLARALIESGRRVLIFAWDRTGKLPKREEGSSIGSLYRMRLRARYGSGLKNLPFLLVWQAFLAVRLISHHRRYDAIHACDFDTVLPALIFGRLFGKKVVFDIFDLYSDSVRGTPAPILKIIAWAEFLAINNADAVILADDSRKQQIAGSQPNKIEVVYNSPAEPEGIKALPKRAEKALCLVYVGLLVKERSLAEVIEIVGRHPDWFLDLAGFGGDQEMILRLAEEHSNICWHGRVDYATALKLTAGADLVFAIYDPAVPNHRYSSPNKVFEAMLLEKPLVVAHGTNMDRIVEAHQCGVVVQYGHVETIEQVLEALAADPGLRQRLGENGGAAYRQHYSWSIMKERIFRLYCEL